eukprot:scaffold41300_cov28-Tisochrysis_lutea.AAC.1
MSPVTRPKACMLRAARGARGPRQPERAPRAAPTNMYFRLAMWKSKEFPSSLSSCSCSPRRPSRTLLTADTTANGQRWLMPTNTSLHTKS